MYSPANDLKIERNIGRFADINQYTGFFWSVDSAY